MSIVHSDELDSPVGDLVTPLEKAVRRVTLDLPDFFNDDQAVEVLELHVGEVVSSSNLLLKSMYEFDLDSEDGVERLLSLLPILDPEIIKTIMQEIWSGYPVDSLNFDNSLARAEIKGYLLDFLDGHGTDAADIDSTDEQEPDGGAETPTGGTAEGTEAKPPQPEQGSTLQA